MFILCSLYAPIHQNKFQVGVNLLGNKYNSDSDLFLKVKRVLFNLNSVVFFLMFLIHWPD